MKFSVLLPTRNRLEFLRHALDSVLRQEYSDWEVIVADNCSEDDVAGYVASLHEPRVRYFRTQEFVPVTDNWNNALEKSTGEYVIMLGDDDCLTPGYFTAMRQLIEKYDAPDFIYTGAYLFAYPGVMPEYPAGYLQPYGYASFLNDEHGPLRREAWINPKEAVFLAQQTMDFRVHYGYNMQFALIGRQLIRELSHKGPFFQSPFPDFYAMNLMFLWAQRILADPRPMVIIGVTPKSYGFYHYNRQEKEGISFLNGQSSPKIARKLNRILLPGTHINDGWLAAVETLAANYPELGLKVSHRRYRLLQTLYVVHGYRTHKTVPETTYRELMKKLRVTEKLSYGFYFVLLTLVKKLLSTRWHAKTVDRLRSKIVGQYPAGEKWHPQVTVGRYKNMIEVFNDLKSPELG